MFRDVPSVGRLKCLGNILKKPLLLARLCTTQSCCSAAVTSCTLGFGAMGVTSSVSTLSMLFSVHTHPNRLPRGQLGRRDTLLCERANSRRCSTAEAGAFPGSLHWEVAAILRGAGGCPLCPNPCGMREDGSCPRLCRVMVSSLPLGKTMPAAVGGVCVCTHSQLCRGWWPLPEPTQPAFHPRCTPILALCHHPSPRGTGNWSFAPSTVVTMGANCSLGNSAGGPPGQGGWRDGAQGWSGRCRVVTGRLLHV